MIELHGGTIALSSREHEGTTVTLRFPVFRVREPRKTGTGTEVEPIAGA